MFYFNANLDYKIFEEFAYHLINFVQCKRIIKLFDLNGNFYAFASTMIGLCMSLYEWAFFKKARSGIKEHTLLDIVTLISTYIHITEAKLRDVKAMAEYRKSLMRYISLTNDTLTLPDYMESTVAVLSLLSERKNISSMNSYLEIIC